MNGDPDEIRVPVFFSAPGRKQPVVYRASVVAGLIAVAQLVHIWQGLSLPPQVQEILPAAGASDVPGSDLIDQDPHLPPGLPGCPNYQPEAFLDQQSIGSDLVEGSLTSNEGRHSRITMERGLAAVAVS